MRSRSRVVVADEAPRVRTDFSTLLELVSLVDGLADKEIAQRLNLGLETVYTYVKNVYHKLRVSGRIELLSRAARGQL